MTQEANGHDKLSLIRTIAREWGALLIVAGMAYYMLAIHSGDTTRQTDAIERNTKAITELTHTIEISGARLSGPSN